MPGFNGSSYCLKMPKQSMTAHDFVRDIGMPTQVKIYHNMLIADDQKCLPSKRTPFNPFLHPIQLGEGKCKFCGAMAYLSLSQGGHVLEDISS
jgi:hypothetical protein